MAGVDRIPTVLRWVGFTALSGLIAVGQYLRGPVLGGDQFVWMNVASWYSNGHSLYREVWDHKDPGLPMLYLLADELGGITPLRLMGLIAGAISSVSVYCVLRWETNPQTRWAASSVSLAMLWSLIAFSSPTWLYTYTENFATAAFLAGLALIDRRALSGLLFGTAVVIKLSFFVPVFIVILLIALSSCDAAVRPAPRGGAFGKPRGALTKASQLLRATAPHLLGLGAVVAVISALLAVFGSLGGWWEVIQFNSRYAVVRREGATWLDSVRISIHASPVGVLSALICLAAGVLVASYVVQKRQSQSDNRFELVSGAFLGVGLMSLLQVPLNLHHWYPAIAFALLVIVSYPRRLPLRFASARLGFFAVGALSVASFVFGSVELFDQSLDDRKVRSAAIPGFETRGAVPSPLTVLMIGSNLEFVPLDEGVPDARLSCRFLVWFWWVEDLNAEEIESCLDTDPDLVIVMDDGKFGPLTTEFVRNLESAGFSRCPSATAAEFYLRTPSDC